MMRPTHHACGEVLLVSDAPIEPSRHEDEGPGPDLDWLSDGPRPDAPTGPALWPTPAQEMDSLPGFTLDDDSVLVPLTPLASNDGPLDEGSDEAGAAAGRPSGRRIRLTRPGARTTAAAGIVGGVVLTVAVLSGGIGLPVASGPGPTREAPAPAASAATPTVDVDAGRAARPDRSAKAAQDRARRQAVALKRQKRRAATRREEEQRAPAPAPVETQQVSDPPAPVQSAPPADPWAGVPGAVREFEPGPWNLGGAS